MKRNIFILVFVAVVIAIYLLAKPSSINYEQFGAKGDGITDDMPAIVAAHNAANEKGVPVRLSGKKTYYIGGADMMAVIKTDTFWGESKFVIDDRKVENVRRPVFQVESSFQPFEISGVETLHRGQGSLGVTLPGDCLVEVEDSTRRVYIRKGKNQNNGTIKSELLVVRKDGTVREDGALSSDFDNISRITARRIDKKRLVVRGGVFTTIANQADSKYNYYHRGISVNRSNVFVEGITHYISGETTHGAPYTAFIGTRYAADVVISDCLLTAHRTYQTIGSAGRPVKMGSYDLQAYKSINILFSGITQTTDIEDRDYWGIFASNFCKALKMEDCVISRFDAHMGVENVDLKGCTFGYMGISVVGNGTMLVEDCEVRARQFLRLRDDYGSFWEGDIIVRNCRFKATGSSAWAPVISGSNTGLHDFGYLCCLPRRVVIDHLEIDDSLLVSPSYEGPVIFDDFKRSPDAVFPFTATGTVQMRNVSVKSGKALILARDPSKFSGYKLQD